MELPVRSRRMAGADGGLLPLMLPLHERHAQSRGGDMGMHPFLPMDSLQGKIRPPVNLFSGSSGVSQRKPFFGSGLPSALPETRHLWRQEQHAGQPRLNTFDGKKGTAGHRRHQERGVDATRGKIKSTAWSNPHGPALGLNVEHPRPLDRRISRRPDLRMFGELPAGGVGERGPSQGVL